MEDCWSLPKYGFFGETIHCSLLGISRTNMGQTNSRDNHYTDTNPRLHERLSDSQTSPPLSAVGGNGTRNVLFDCPLDVGQHNESPPGLVPSQSLDLPTVLCLTPEDDFRYYIFFCAKHELIYLAW